MNFINVYYPTWIDSVDLQSIPEYIDYVTLAFIRTNPGNIENDSKMNEFFYNGNISVFTLKEEIDRCRKSGITRTILASVGGEIAGNFEDINFENIAKGIELLDLDGIDIDYEPNGVMAESEGEVKKYIELIIGFRRVFDKIEARTGKKLIITCAPTGIGLLKKEKFNELKKIYGEVKDKLSTLIPQIEQEEELNWGTLKDSNILKQNEYRVGTVGSCFNFNSAGKMTDVFLCENYDKELIKYKFIGQMVDIVFYQAYNMGSGNTLGKIICYESHRHLSDFFNSVTEGSGFKIGHGSHIGREAWPHYSYTKKRLSYIYSYINKYGRSCDGASFWSYKSSYIDETENVPNYGMEYTSTEGVFKHISTIFRGENENKKHK
ncbi:MAG: hypothetical protein JXR64_11065 [Spirochaetales bacterium]|nr:hypothetical protein [Spirochaetales bacterium]